uniref:ZP domain-containing protein n=1 Tax=Branchiostoma floridae TaxID=7739 RepID=C3ZV59_BRAFL|eukprot:XP_002587583.1 hypothetical protein BRAFLDRAFT_127705 [Branchiostoma floridae]
MAALHGLLLVFTASLVLGYSQDVRNDIPAYASSDDGDSGYLGALVNLLNNGLTEVLEKPKRQLDEEEGSGSPEELPPTESVQTFECNVNETVSFLWRCDGGEDCADGADEADCDGFCGDAGYPSEDCACDDCSAARESLICACPFDQCNSELSASCEDSDTSDTPTYTQTKHLVYGGRVSAPCYELIQLFFVVDGSASLGIMNFEKVKKFMRDAVDSFVIGPGHTSAAVIQYAYDYRQEIKLNQYQDSASLKNAIACIVYLDGAGTQTAAAINAMVNAALLVPTSGKRMGMVITDGRSQQGRMSVLEASDNERPNSIVYRNRVTQDWQRRAHSEPIIRDCGFILDYSCELPRHKTVVADYNPIVQPDRYSERGEGQIYAILRFCREPGCPAYITEYPVMARVCEDIYVEIQLVSADPDLSILTERCVARDTPTIVTGTTVYELVRDGCPVDPTYHELAAPNHATDRFKFEAFKFVTDFPKVYLTCDLLVCKSSDLGNRCSQGCQRTVVGKRSVDDRMELRRTIVSGPLVMEMDGDRKYMDTI